MIRRGDWVYRPQTDTSGDGWFLEPVAEEKAREEAIDRQLRQDEEDERREREAAKHDQA